MKVQDKEIVVGGGVQIRVEGTRFRVTGEVLRLDEEQNLIYVKGEDFDGWVKLENVADVMDPGTFALDHATNILAWQRDSSET